MAWTYIVIERERVKGIEMYVLTAVKSGNCKYKDRQTGAINVIIIRRFVLLRKKNTRSGYIFHMCGTTIS